MTATKNQDVEMAQGDYKVMKVTVYNRLKQIIPLNTGTMTASYVATSVQNSRTALISKSTADGGIYFGENHTGSVEGLMYIQLDPDDSVNLSGMLWHEARIVENGLPNIVLTGELNVLVSAIQ